MLKLLLFTFQYVSILMSHLAVLLLVHITIYIPICFYFNATTNTENTTIMKIYIPICFYFNHGRPYYFNCLYAIYIPICFYFNGICIIRNINVCNIYIPICFYFNPSPEFPLLFYLISPLSVDQPKFTNILPYLLH